jgi:hypothetical protein
MSDLCNGRMPSAIEITKARICDDQKPREFNGAVGRVPGERQADAKALVSAAMIG